MYRFHFVTFSSWVKSAYFTSLPKFGFWGENADCSNYPLNGIKRTVSFTSAVLYVKTRKNVKDQTYHVSTLSDCASRK